MTLAEDFIDLRSDTVTKPSPAMRRAMAQAETGDDVLDHDPTMAELEARVASLVGAEAGLFMVSGCMSNAVALMGHLGRGQAFLAPKDAHILAHELGTPAWLANGLPIELPWTVKPGVPAPDDVAAVAAEQSPNPAYYETSVTLLALENSHNHAGGTIIPPDVNLALIKVAHDAGWAVHLDGARIWHSAAAVGLTPAEAVGPADTVSVCLSKGLGAPVGSVLCGSTDFIKTARRLRKMLGGGIRQGGVLAAAGLVALDEELPRIDEDRQRAVRLAEALRDLGFAAPTPDTNILMAGPVGGSAVEARDLAARWNQAGVGCFTMGPWVRLVTHRDITDEKLTQAIARISAA